MEHSNSDHTGSRPSWLANIVLFGLLAVAAFYLLTEHRAHLFGILPWLLLLLPLLACPFMHLFMHRGHHQHANRESKPNALDPQQPRPGRPS